MLYKMFLKAWKTEELEPLRKLKGEVPWHEFLSHYSWNGSCARH